MMKNLIDEVLSMAKELDENKVAHYVNRLADQFRNGEDLRALKPLLENQDPRLVWIGAWIVSEVVDGRRGREVFGEISKLLKHPDPAVRFAAIAGTALLTKPSEFSVTQQLLLLAIDGNPGVRQQAFFYLCLIPDDIVKPLANMGIWPDARLLLDGVSKDELRSALGSSSLLSQRLAVVGVMRNFGNSDSSLTKLISDLGSEVIGATSHLPRNKCIRIPKPE